jgi:AFG3 family protein
MADGTLGPGPRFKVTIGSIDAFERRLEEEQRLLGIPSSDFVPVIYKRSADFGKMFMQFLPTIIFVGLLFSLRRSMMGGMGGLGGSGKGGGAGGMFGVGKSTHKKISKEDVSVTFKDVAGVDNAKKEIMEFVQFLQNPSKFSKLGAKLPKGALLCGPPGTGKTLLAKAVAGEASVPFFSISGSDFLEMFVGVGPSRVRDLFREARENAPCIVWIDEIDAVGRKRGKGGFSGSNDERENTLNQMLVEMDGFDDRTSVVVLAGTNRQDILDEALLRPGRFDRQITVSKPDLKGRKDIFKVHLRPLTLQDDPDDIAGRLAGLTPGFSGADIQNVCNEAAIFAARGSKEKIEEADFESAIDRVIGGLEAPKIMTPDEKRRVAFHEAGHAIAGWFLEYSDPLLKVTIIPRSSGALGFAQYLPKELALRTKEQIDDIVTMALGGRAAEEIVFGSVTTGAQDDLRKVSNIIYSTIKDFGMSKELGNLAFPTEPNAYGQVERNYSESTAELIDREAKKEVSRLYERTLQLLTEKKAEMTKVAELLLEKETITHDEIISLIGDRPFPGSEEYQQFISRKKAMKQNEADKAKAAEPGKNEEEEEEEGDESHLQPAM